MRLSDLKPCAICGGQLIKPPMVTWHVIRVSTALLHPEHARETLALNQYFNGALRLAEVMSPGGDKAVVILADEPGASWREIHVCFDCYAMKLGHLPGAIEQSTEQTNEESTAGADLRQ